jgi:hypothetical protein
MTDRCAIKCPGMCIGFGLAIPILCIVVGCEREASSGENHETIDLQSRGLGDAACGPRCINHVLEYFGKKKVFLPKLMEEVGVSKERSGASFDRLKLALENHGIYAEFARLGSFDVLTWRAPVILHFNNHFFVHSVDASDDTIVLRGIESGAFSSYGDMYENISPVVLLTSNAPIAGSSQFAECRLPVEVLICCFSAFSACLLVLLNTFRGS